MGDRQTFIPFCGINDKYLVWQCASVMKNLSGIAADWGSWNYMEGSALKFFSLYEVLLEGLHLSFCYFVCILHGLLLMTGFYFGNQISEEL